MRELNELRQFSPTTGLIVGPIVVGVVGYGTAINHRLTAYTTQILLLLLLLARCHGDRGG